MGITMVKSLKHLWEIWDLRAFMIISLSLQTFLILFAPLRKRTTTSWTIVPLWSAYLLADWAATFAVGLISNSQNDSPSQKPNNNNADLLAFWAPILLVHLGGPDTITAFALEDNELWLRHLLSLITQTAAAVYVFFQSLPKNQLWVPNLLMFISGLIKYFERVMSLHGASLNSFRDSMLEDPDPGPTYAKLMNEYHWKKEANLPTRIEMVPEPEQGNKGVNRVKEGNLTPTEVILYAHRFFEIFKGLLVDLIFSLRERKQSRDFFRKRTAEDAFKVMEVELNLMYDVLFTKVRVVYTSAGYFFRFVSFASFFTTLGLFYCEDKSNFEHADVTITYALLLGGIALDVISFYMIITSDWLLVDTKKLPDVNLEDSLETTTQERNSGFLGKPARLLRRRWCESVSAYNLIFYSRNRRKDVKEEFIGTFGLTKFLDGLRYVKQKPFTETLRDHIFKEMMAKSEIADDLETAKSISAVKGESVLQSEGCGYLLRYVRGVDYDQSLLLWHIATELCYCEEINNSNGKEEKNDDRDISKLLSDYMMYLLIMQPAMMSVVAGIGQIRFRDTCAEAVKFLDKGSSGGNQKKKKPGVLHLIIYGVYSCFKYFCFALLSPIWALLYLLLSYLIYPIMKYACGEKRKHGKMGRLADRYYSRVMGFISREPEFDKGQIEDCMKILEVSTDVEPIQIKGDRSKSVLFDGCMLAKKLNRLDNKWEIVSKVWVEMLSYAAIRCRANSHAQELSKGGELITFVWLLMVHFGLGSQYQISEGHERAKLIVDK